MITRSAKLLLLAGVAFFYSLVVYNNLTDFNSNYQLVRHVLMMDTTFPGNHGMWRALTSSAADYSFYIAIIVWEIVTAILLWWGCVALSRAIRGPAMNFEAAKRIPVYCADAIAPDVAGGVHLSWRGMVPHVAIAGVERRGNRLSRFHNRWHCAARLHVSGT